MERVLIIGGGLAGCSTAWHLAPDVHVLLLEQAEQPGAEATAQNAGMVRRLGEDPYERALALRTAAWMAAPGDDWAESPPSRVVGAVLGLAHDPGHLHDAVAHLRAAGVRVDALTPEDLPPALAGSPLTAAWYVADERVADAHALLSGFLRGARRHGAEVRCGTRVLELLREGDRCVGVRTDQGTHHADRVVLAGGAWSAGLAAGAGLHRPLIPVRRTLAQTAPHPLSRADHPWCWIDDAGVYARPEAGGWLCSPCDEAIDPPAAGPGSKGPLEPEARALLADKLDRWVPAVADARLESGWSGLRTFAPDRRPILGPDPELDGLWWAAGLGGFGVTCSYAVGECVAAWMRGEELPWIRPRGVSAGRAFPAALADPAHRRAAPIPARRHPRHPHGGPDRVAWEPHGRCRGAPRCGVKAAQQVVPSTVDEVLHALGELGPCWVVDGAWGFDKGRFRRGCVVTTPEDTPRIAWDGYVSPDDMDRLTRILGARRGDGNAMFATAWQLMWTCDGGPLRVIDREGLLLRADNGLASVRGVGVVRPSRVEAWVDPDWIRRGVRLVDALGDEVLLAETHEWVAAIDPTYDWIDLDCDAGWASAAAAAIGRALGVHVRVSWD